MKRILCGLVFRGQYLFEVKRARRHDYNAAWNEKPSWKSISATGVGGNPERTATST